MTLHEYILEVLIRKEDVFKQKISIGTRSKGYRLDMNSNVDCKLDVVFYLPEK